MNPFRSPRASATPPAAPRAIFPKPLTRTAALLTCLALMTSCSAPKDGGSSGNDAGSSVNAGASTVSSGELSGTLTVFAASSLQKSFNEIADTFKAANPDVTVRLNFAGSSDLATQIVAGAPADVFASADVRTMDRLAEMGLLAANPDLFATNTLTIAVPPGNPAGVTSFQDLAKPEMKVVLCAPQVPCGAAAVAVEQAADTEIAPVSEESSVTDVLGKVATGQADAGLVYVTDVAAAEKTAENAVEGIAFPEATATTEARNSYPIAPVTDGRKDLADAFTALVIGTKGQQILDSYGFGNPG